MEGVSWVPCAGHAGQNGRQGVRGLAWEQGSGADRQVYVPEDHGVNGLEVPAVFQRWLRDPHLVVVAAFQHHHDDSAAGVPRRRLRVCLRPNRLRVSLNHRPEVVPALRGCPTFPVREAIVRWDVEGVCVQ